MIKPKPKKCKGTGKAIGNGCGMPEIPHKFGLCLSCFKKWVFHTSEGELFLKSTQIRAKNDVKKQSRKEQAEKTKIKTEKTIELMSADKYREKYVQPIFNEIARLIDYGQPCIATGSHSGKMSGGHYHSVGSNRTTALNLHNIHIQSFQSNGPKGGDNILYRLGIIKVYGNAYMEQIEALKQIKPLHLSKSDLMEIKKVASDIRNKLKSNMTVYSTEKRIELREKINQKIGIYK